MPGRLRSSSVQQRAEHADGRHRREAESQRAGRAAVDPPGHVAGALDEREQPVGLVEEGAPGLGQRDPAVVALEQGHPDRALELLDLPAQRRLRHVEPLGRAAEVQLLGDGDEGADLVEGHHAE